MASKKFKVVYAVNGTMFTRVLEAESIESARTISRKFGKVIKIEKKGGFNFDPPLELPDRQIILLRLAGMAASKVSISEALSLMEENYSGTIRRICGRLLKLVETGDDLAVSMEKIGSPHFPASVIALVKAGSQTGNTAVALRNAAKFEAEMEQIKRGGMTEFLTGIVGFLAAILTTFGTTRYMAPMMNESDLMKIAADNAKVPVFEILGTISEIVIGISGILFFALVLLASIGRMVVPLSADKLILKIPLYKDLILSRNNYTILYSLALLIGSGVQVNDALRISAENAPAGVMKSDLVAAHLAAKNGSSWPKAMVSLHPTDRASLGLVLDRKGTADALEALSDQYKSLYASRIATLAPMLKTIAALYLMMGGAVLFGLTIMPILKMASAGF